MSKQMKVIMENWRRTIIEADETTVDDIENPKGVEQLIGAINNKNVNKSKLVNLLSKDDTVGAAIKDLTNLITSNPDQEEAINESIVDFLKNVAIDPKMALKGSPLGDKILKYAPSTLALAFVALKLAGNDPEPLGDPDTIKAITSIIKSSNASEDLLGAAIETLEESKNENH
jgi:hypothetical protein